MKIIDNYWIKRANNLIWKKAPKLGCKKTKGKYYWFNDGKINIAENCLLNKNNKQNNKTAIIFIDKKKKVKAVNYRQLTRKVHNFASFINDIQKQKNLNIKNVLIHSSASTVSAISMLALAKLGIHFSVIFEDLPEAAINERIKLIKPDLIITRDDKKLIFFKQSINKINLINSCIISTSVAFKNNNQFVNYNFDNFNVKSAKIDYDYFESNNELFTLFTSGSTGKPKGIQHSSGGYMVYSKFSSTEKFGMNNNSVVFTASDAGWINGHTYALFSPLSLGATTVLIESPFMLLDYIFLNKILKKFKITILYLPVTLLRLLKSVIPVEKKSFQHKLKAIGAMGEPLAKSIAEWYSSYFFKKKKAIVNTYFQTETGGIICAPNYDANAQESYGTVGTPLNKFIKFKRKNNKKFELELLNPWPGCMINVINGKKYWKKYWNKNKFKLFDYGSTYNKNLIVHGRSDDVINIRGHRLGSGEVEAKVLELKNLIEVCAISIKNSIEGSTLILFVVKNSTYNIKETKELIQSKICDTFGSFALPGKIYFVKELPKTKSGKILRRVLRVISTDKNSNNFGDLSTMLNNKSISKIKKIL